MACHFIHSTLRWPRTSPFTFLRANLSAKPAAHPAHPSPFSWSTRRAAHQGPISTAFAERYGLCMPFAASSGQWQGNSTHSVWRQFAKRQHQHHAFNSTRPGTNWTWAHAHHQHSSRFTGRRRMKRAWASREACRRNKPRMMAALNWTASELHKKMHQACDLATYRNFHQCHSEMHAKRADYKSRIQAMYRLVASSPRATATADLSFHLVNKRPYSLAASQNLVSKAPPSGSSANGFGSSPPPKPPTPSPFAYRHHTSTFPLRTAVLSFSVRPLAPIHSVTARLLSTQAHSGAPSDCLAEMVAFANTLLRPATRYMKSTAALNALATIWRVSLTLFPFSLRSKILSIFRAWYLRDPTSAGRWVRHAVDKCGPTDGFFARLNARYLFPLILGLPIALLGVAVLVSTERTPVTGRRRIVMVSQEEERQLAASVLGISGSLTARHNWVGILSGLLGLKDEGVSANGRPILFGGEVLDHCDWRFRWTEAVLRALEAEVPRWAESGAGSARVGVPTPPPSSFPISGRLSGAPMVKADYDLLIIDRPDEANALSFGFGPEESVSEGRRGVIVVFTGFIDKVLKTESARVPVSPLGDPSVLPTQEETKSLSVLLSHELAHLLLSHPLESYASSSLFVPRVSRMFSDVLRTLVFPFTMVLGPFLHDAIGSSLQVASTEGFGFGALGQLCISGGSRSMEQEADLVSLRILSHAGVEPHYVLDWWRERLKEQDSTLLTGSTQPHFLRSHTPSTKLSGVAEHHSHPDAKERVRNIEAELQRWENYHLQRL